MVDGDITIYPTNEEQTCDSCNKKGINHVICSNETGGGWINICPTCAVHIIGQCGFVMVLVIEYDDGSRSVNNAANTQVFTCKDKKVKSVTVREFEPEDNSDRFVRKLPGETHCMWDEDPKVLE